MKYMPFIMLAALLACGKPKGILPVNAMKQIVVDISRAEEFVNQYLAKDSAIDIGLETKRRIAAVYLLHKTSEQQFLQSMSYYRADPNRLRILIDSVNTHANRMRDQTFADTLSTPSGVVKPRTR